MDPMMETVLSEYDARRASEADKWRLLQSEERRTRIDEFLLSVGPATGKLVNLLARESGAASILDLGTSYGYSTVWLAEAARANGGTVTGVERADYKLAHTTDALRRAGLGENAVLRQGDVLEVLEDLEGPFDFVLLDVWKDLYIPCFDLLLPRLAPGALLVADNMIEPSSARLNALKFRKHVDACDGVDAVLLPVGSGLLLCRFRTS